MLDMALVKIKRKSFDIFSYYLLSNLQNKNAFCPFFADQIRNRVIKLELQAKSSGK